jgi:hypothetical protein
MVSPGGFHRERQKQLKGDRVASVCEDPSMSNQSISEEVATALVGMFRLNEYSPLGVDTDPFIPRMILPLIDALRDECPIDEHGFDWDPDGWTAGLSHRWTGARLTDVLTAVNSLNNEVGPRVERQHLHRLATADVLVQLVGVMAWGYGSRGMGWWHLAQVLERNSDTSGRLGPALQKLDALRRLANSADPTALATSWLDERHYARVTYLRAAFASKLAYAAAPPGSSWGSPLIADRWVAWGLWMFTGLWDVRTSPELYRRYLHTASTWATSCRCRPDEIERALFTVGPLAAAAWASRQIE